MRLHKHISSYWVQVVFLALAAIPALATFPGVNGRLRYLFGLTEVSRSSREQRLS